jgi:hypothetical protein
MEDISAVQLRMKIIRRVCNFSHNCGSMWANPSLFLLQHVLADLFYIAVPGNPLIPKIVEGNWWAAPEFGGIAKRLFPDVRVFFCPT